MGSWGHGVFDSDDSLDFLGTLGKRPTKRAVLNALARARDPERAELLLATPAVYALCAAEIIAASLGRRAPDAPDTVAAMNLDWTAKEDDVALAARAVENVAVYSDLAELVDDAGSYAAWIAVLDDLRARLNATTPLSRERPAFESTIPGEPALTDVESAIDAMRAGALRAAALRYKLRATKEGLRMFARATLPAETTERGKDEELGAHDAELLEALGSVNLRVESRVLEEHKTRPGRFHLDDLASPLWRLYCHALLAGRRVRAGGEERVAIDGLLFANLALDLLHLLGGDAEVGLLSLVAGKRADRDGSFGRALAFAYACGIWGVATLEDAASERAPTRLVGAAPLLVLARFVLRLRASWGAKLAPAFAEAARRAPVWSKHPPARLDDICQRANVLADFLAVSEASPPPAAASSRDIAPGSLVVQKRRGVTLAVAISGSNLLVGTYAQPNRPYTRVAVSFVSPVQAPAAAGRVVLGTPSDISQHL